MRFVYPLLLFTATAGVLAAADSPFVGKWKLNPAKSQLAGITTTYEQLPSGEIMTTSGGQSYKFKMDGKDYPAPFGSTIAWKQIDSNTWESTTKNPGMQTTNAIKLSADGKTLTETVAGKKPNGESFETTATSQRVSGGPGLMGKWKSTHVKPVNEMWEIKASGADGICVEIADYQAEVDLQFDGKDYAPTGPTVPKNFTMSAKKTGPRSFDMIEKFDGKVVYNDSFSVSADGKVMTLESGSPGSNEKVKVVYDRQ